MEAKLANHRFIVASLLAFFITAGAFGQSTYKDKKTGVTISFETENSMFPDSWWVGDIKAEVRELDKKDYSRVKDVLQVALNKYPSEVVKKNLRKVYVLDELKFFGVGYGGTYYEDAVFLLIASDNYLEQVFHAEFSSILLENYEDYFPKDQWEACNPDTFEYGGTGLDYIKNNKGGQRYESQLNEMGFVNRYGTSNLENDFNQYVKNTFRPKEGFWELLDEYPLLRCKFKIMVEFYHHISPVFTEQYFRSLDN